LTSVDPVPPVTASKTTTAVARSDRAVLAISLAVTAALYVIPFGRTIAWPLVLVSTLAHELGHGLAALALGGTFHSLRLYADGSGVALWSGALGRVALASVAAAGLVGPAAVACALLILGRRASRAPVVLMTLGVFLVLLALFLVRNPFGLMFTILLGAALSGIGLRAPALSHTVVLLLAVQLALSVFSRSDYLFTSMALTSSGPMPSDVAVMASALLLPYWLWGAICGAASLGLLALGVHAFFRR
jgi:hypothetical protein